MLLDQFFLFLLEELGDGVLVSVDIGGVLVLLSGSVRLTRLELGGFGGETFIRAEFPLDRLLVVLVLGVRLGRAGGLSEVDFSQLFLVLFAESRALGSEESGSILVDISGADGLFDIFGGDILLEVEFYGLVVVLGGYGDGAFGVLEYFRLFRDLVHAILASSEVAFAFSSLPKLFSEDLFWEC